ncbi:hypothetical protein E2C01_007364 [Portunus trituberculatus]|uniref:Uncharacterized protein n=1 Tax=Portunus trituberculatus TaxID=210409 RepID=A0A5B7CXQ2_PORTR|nr:hypothetical protein [Portunus trituberculatus]
METRPGTEGVKVVVTRCGNLRRGFVEVVVTRCGEMKRRLCGSSNFCSLASLAIMTLDDLFPDDGERGTQLAGHPTQCGHGRLELLLRQAKQKPRVLHANFIYSLSQTLA